MKTSVEISMYPLLQEYGTPILKFIERLRQYNGLRVKSNTMSTQVFGEYDLVMQAITVETKAALQSEEAVVFVVKIVNLDLSPESES